MGFLHRSFKDVERATLLATIDALRSSVKFPRAKLFSPQAMLCGLLDDALGCGLDALVILGRLARRRRFLAERIVFLSLGTLVAKHLIKLTPDIALHHSVGIALQVACFSSCQVLAPELVNGLAALTGDRLLPDYRPPHVQAHVAGLWR